MIRDLIPDIIWNAVIMTHNTTLNALTALVMVALVTPSGGLPLSIHVKRGSRGTPNTAQ